jgi:hypothetical protein
VFLKRYIHNDIVSDTTGARYGSDITIVLAAVRKNPILEAEKGKEAKHGPFFDAAKGGELGKSTYCSNLSERETVFSSLFFAPPVAFAYKMSDFSLSL